MVQLPVRVNWGGGWTDTPPYCNEKGGIVLMSSHDTLELALCDKWYIMKNGRLNPFVYTGDLDELVKNL